MRLALMSLLMVPLAVGCMSDDSCKSQAPEEDETWCASSRYVTEACALDGDTFVLGDCGATDQLTERVRILGIDTPEIQYGGEEGECYAEEAHDYLSSLLKRPKIRLDFDQECTGYYGRTLAHVVIEDDCEDLLVSQLIVGKGYGTVYESDDGHRYYDRLMAAQERAQAEGAGLWGACD
jgi:micrococcal nuclease